MESTDVYPSGPHRRPVAGSPEVIHSPDISQISGSSGTYAWVKPDRASLVHFYVWDSGTNVGALKATFFADDLGVTENMVVVVATSAVFHGVTATLASGAQFPVLVSTR